MRSRRAVAVAAAAIVIVAGAFAGLGRASVQVSRSGWDWSNPTPQGRTLRAIAFSAGVGYAVGSGGTALSTASAGSSWNGLTTGTSGELERVQAVDPSTVVVGGAGGCTTRISDNGGATFTRIFNYAESGCPEPVASFSFVSPQVGYLLLANGSVEATADGGETFARRTAIPGTPTSSSGGSATAVSLSFLGVDDGIAFVRSTSGSSQEFTTSDGGVSWTPVTLPAGAQVTFVDFVDALHGFAVGPNTMLATGDGGQTWSARPIAVGSSFSSINCWDAKHCVLTPTAGNSLVITSDGGLTDDVKTPSSSLIYGAAFVSPTQIVAVGGGGATVYSGDGGKTFSTLSADIGGEYVHLRAGPEGMLLAPGARGDVAISRDEGQTWQVIATQTSAQLLDAAFATPQLGYALDATGGLQQTSNGGASWQTLNPGTTQPAKAVAAVAGAVLLIGPVGIHRAVSGGRFEAVAGRAVAAARVSDYTLAGGAVFAFGPGGSALIRSSNAGASWNAIRLPLTNRRGRTAVRIRSVAFTSATRGMLLDTAGRLWLTSNAGASWREVVSTGTSEGVQLAFSDAGHGFMTLGAFAGGEGNAYVLRTSDGGRTWRPQSVADGSIGEDGLAVLGPLNAGLLLDGAIAPGAAPVPRLLFVTGTGGEIYGPHESLVLSTPRASITRAALRRSHGTVVVDGTLTGALGGEQIVVSRRAAGGGAWQHQIVTAGANGGSFTTSWHVGASSVFVAQWAGDSGRGGVASGALQLKVR